MTALWRHLCYCSLYSIHVSLSTTCIQPVRLTAREQVPRAAGYPQLIYLGSPISCTGQSRTLNGAWTRNVRFLTFSKKTCLWALPAEALSLPLHLLQFLLPSSGGRSVSIVRLRTKGHAIFCLFCYHPVRLTAEWSHSYKTTNHMSTTPPAGVSSIFQAPSLGFESWYKPRPSRGGQPYTSSSCELNSVALSPQANFTDWATATCRRNLVSTSADRGVSRGQRGGQVMNFVLKTGYTFKLWTTFGQPDTPSSCELRWDSRIYLQVVNYVQTAGYTFKFWTTFWQPDTSSSCGLRLDNRIYLQVVNYFRTARYTFKLWTSFWQEAIPSSCELRLDNRIHLQVVNYVWITA
jgi:hypothetical protein